MGDESSHLILNFIIKKIPHIYKTIIKPHVPQALSLSLSLYIYVFNPEPQCFLFHQPLKKIMKEDFIKIRYYFLKEREMGPGIHGVLQHQLVFQLNIQNYRTMIGIHDNLKEGILKTGIFCFKKKNDRYASSHLDLSWLATGCSFQPKNKILKIINNALNDVPFNKASRQASASKLKPTLFAKLVGGQPGSGSLCVVRSALINSTGHQEKSGISIIPLSPMTEVLAF
ncbi:hypothetical protein BpHYR1_008101 [Brachionus plicatilis]|uniref:Uncharacterized protein n=1 Tax=Brachionus plicatilis TaxID=10195 RepID=A0A3M7QYW2_BRAPC|nr:hypothetical protein BpHYR1_008101 [Brachionus plicatilis]